MNHQTSVSTQKLCQHEDRHGETLPFQKPSSAKSSGGGALLRRTIRQLNYIRISDGATILAVYKRRLGDLNACSAAALREAA